MFNIDSKTLNCVLFGIIITIIIILFVRMLNNKKEGLNIVKDEEITVKHKFDEIKKNTPTCNIVVDSESKSTMTDDSETVSSLEETVPTKKKSLIKPPPQYCDTNEHENINERLIRDIVIGKKLQQGEKQHEFSKNEVDNYFDQFQDFNQKINYSSQNRCDMVEKIAQDRTQNTEFVNKQGLTIGEVFDGMTKDQLDDIKKCKYPNCVIPAKYDNLTQRQMYMDREHSVGGTYTNYQNRYETDNVNNGGKFYDDIEAHDEDLMNSMALKY
jgi:hypothetical protein